VTSRSAVHLGLGLVLGLLLSLGCAQVEPWERERLALPAMQPEPHPLHSDLLDHVRRSRESGAGGGLSSGGGCGCD